MRLDRRPWVYEDKIASELIDLDRQIADGYDLEFAMQPLITATRGVFLVRERYCEDVLARRVSSGAAQYVILGAGLNGFAYGVSPLANSVRIFEVDHPSTQAWKKSRLREIGVEVPNNLIFVPIDFSQEDLGDVLIQNGFDQRSPAVFAWNGVTQYLPDEAINNSLFEIQKVACPGSTLIIQITIAKHLVDQKSQDAIDFYMDVSAEQGEPWINAHDPIEFAERLSRFEFGDVKIFSSSDAIDKYFTNRSDRLTVNDHFSMLSAQIE